MNGSSDKIYIITFQHVLNNGGLLQAYALSNFLIKNDIEVQILNYKPWYFMLQTYRPAKGFRKSLTKLKKILNFKRFRKHLPITEKSYYSIKGLRRLGDAACIICGSDQIWNTNLTGGAIDSAYYLEFAQSPTRKVAYAASSGSTPVRSNWKVIGPLLEDFSAVGLRERNTCLDIGDLAPELNPQLVVDPSLLIDDYEEVANYSRVPEGDFLLTYVVGSGESLKLFDDFVSKAKAIYKLPVVHIGAKDIYSSDVTIDGVGPDEWVAFFKSAKNVITNSFHGTAFSVNFKKQFFFFPNTEEILNERQMTLLDGVGLTERRITELDGDQGGLFTPINYEVVTPKLERMVDESSRFLLGSLN
jgi:hypothetical protein